MAWEPAEKVQKNEAGEYRAMIGGEWVPVAKAQKNDAGEYRVERSGAPSASPVGAGGTPSRVNQVPGLENTQDPQRDKTQEMSAIESWLAKRGNILKPGQEDFVRRTLQGASSGPVMGTVQEIASLTGNKSLAAKIAKNAEEGNFLGSMMQPETWLTGRAAGNFIGKGEGLLSKGLRAAPIGAAYGLTSATKDTENPETSRLETAAAGGAISFLSPALFAGIAKGAGWAIDAAKGRLAAIRAGRVLRDVADAERPQLEAALKAAGNDVTAAQAAESVGSTKFSALGARAAQQDSQFTNDLMERQAANRDLVMSRNAGGSSSQDAALRREFMIQQAANNLEPNRKAILDELASSGKELAEILPKLSEIERNYILALQNQGARTAEAAISASGQAERIGVRPNPSFGTKYSPPYLKSKTGGDAPIDSARSLEKLVAANDSEGVAKQLRVEADALRAQISALPAVFTTAPIKQQIAAQLGSKSTQMNAEKTAVLSAVLKKLKIAGDDPAALAELRKMGVNQLIGDLINNGKLSKTAAASALLDVKRAIDTQLGTRYVNQYLEPFSKKLATRDSMELSNELRLMQKNSPKQFVEAMRGESTDLIEKFSATAKTMQEALGEKRYNQLRLVAKQIERDMNLETLASKGATEVGDILVKDASKGVRLPNFLSWKSTLANKALEIGENALDAKTMALVYRALRNGKDTAALMAEIPTSDKSAVLRLIKSGAITPYINPMVTSGANQ